MRNSTYFEYLAGLLVCAIALLTPQVGNAQETSKAVHPIFGEWQYIEGTPGKVMSDKPIRLTFRHRPKAEHHVVGGHGGCNSVGRRFKIVGSAVVLEGPRSATRLFCGGPLRATEAMVMRILGHETGWSVKGSTLVLYDASGQPFATFKKITQ